MTHQTLRPFTTVLRRQGFEFCWRTRAGGLACTQFAKRQGDRELHVQLFDNGKHRVSHGIYDKYGLAETTYPTDFRTVPEMVAAIEHEWKRAT